MQYVFSMTSRMVTIAATCALLLCVLLFVLGIEIGARFFATAPATSSSSTPVSAATASAGTMSPPPASSGGNDLAAAPASSTL